MTAALSAWSERRPPRTAHERREIAEAAASHLPPAPRRTISAADLDAMRAAFIRRFDEDLPRTETLMAVAGIGYRMALRDLQPRCGCGDARSRASDIRSTAKAFLAAWADGADEKRMAPLAIALGRSLRADCEGGEA